MLIKQKKIYQTFSVKELIKTRSGLIEVDIGERLKKN